MKCSVFIATSVDGYIATPDGGVDWLEAAGDPGADMDEFADMGFGDYLATVDCMIMGRKCLEKIASFELTPEQWPYGDIPIVTLSNTLSAVPAGLPPTVELYSGEIDVLIEQLETRGCSHAYVDGGTTITGLLELGLINEITLTRAPVILGGGLPLFGELSRNIKLEQARAQAYPNGFVQERYQVSYR